jgi:DNA polymerase-3 subunit alpha
VSKQGKGWALFTIEDYTDTFEFRIFGEDYLKHRMFLVKNTFVHVKTFVREGWVNRETGKKSDPRLQFNGFQLLHDIMEHYAKRLTIQLNIKELHEETVVRLKELLQMHPGNQMLNFVVYDNKEQIKIQLASRRQKVKVSQELLSELESENILFKLN